MLDFLLDTHDIPQTSWGIRPILFHIGGLGVTSYAFFVGLGMIAGGIVYWRHSRKFKQNGDHVFYVALAAILGGAIGAKLLEWAINYQYVAVHFNDINTFIYGRTLVGGLLGGLAGVLIVKRKLGIKQRMGNAFAPAVALGVAIGRIGCFLTGCCYGKPTGFVVVWREFWRRYFAPPDPDLRIAVHAGFVRVFRKKIQKRGYQAGTIIYRTAPGLFYLPFFSGIHQSRTGSHRWLYNLSNYQRNSYNLFSIR